MSREGAAGGDALGSRRLRQVVAPRGEKRQLDPWRPIRLLAERERLPGPAPQVPQEVVPALAIFVAGAECPFRCVFCDLWRETLDGPTPDGAVARQVELALRVLDGATGEDPDLVGVEIPEPFPLGDTPLGSTVIKLYNASNFFEPRAVPVGDLAQVGRLLAEARRVVVECHPRLLVKAGGGAGPGMALCRELGSLLGGTLEVAMGLETVHPEAFPRLNKGMELDDFARATEALLSAGAAVRAFVLVGAPYVPAEEAVEWAVRSAEHAFARGVRNVALIPVRGGGGALDLLAREGLFAPPRLDQLEAALEAALALPAVGAGAVVTADLWDLERFSSCPTCLPARRERLERANLTGRLNPLPTCPACGAG